jgi:hypothetical protein
MLLQLAAEVISRFLRFRLTPKLTRRELCVEWSALLGMAPDRVCNRSGCYQPRFSAAKSQLISFSSTALM